MTSTVSLTAAEVLRIAPQARPDIVAALVAGDDQMAQSGINTPLRMAHFFAQILTETGGFTIYEEDMNYSAERLIEVWPSHFNASNAGEYAHNPEKLADYIYADANRGPSYKLGNTQPGDGWRYIGRGLIQTTGRDGYRAVGHENDPESLKDPAIGLVAAIDEFVRSGCLALADADNVDGVRRRINGGLIGIDDCVAWLAKAKAVFAAAPGAPMPWDAPEWQHFPSPKIAWVQDALNQLQRDIQPRLPDGINGPRTAFAVSAWQRDHGLRIDGVVGNQTTSSIIAAMAANTGG